MADKATRSASSKQAGEVHKCVPAEQDDDCIALGGNESEHKHILASTVVALRNRLPKRALGMENDFFMFRTDKVINDMGS